MVIECEDGSSYIVGGQHHHPTYLKRTDTSLDFPKPKPDEG